MPIVLHKTYFLSSRCSGSIPLHHLERYNMDMTYTTNPNLPRLRMQTALLVIRNNWSTRQVARHTGFNQSTIARWVQIAKRSNNKRLIPTISSRPHNHPHQFHHH